MFDAEEGVALSKASWMPATQDAQYSRHIDNMVHRTNVGSHGHDCALLCRLCPLFVRKGDLKLAESQRGTQTCILFACYY